ncbi:MAG TPA: tRNA (N(6)-L-threonylcarbamoyladenosine(37)-C(2))-methylthiotransferase MtaB [Clostridiales bacterium]|jgi:threonylcarbamoyladenosine tRNA methylthiotransferase MtaB|nr:tRNA (N(6)-L-threonylcarbamoyladenosine(37)-C(2))-methylthiotransferase MtaB [Clostridiales bacterium]
MKKLKVGYYTLGCKVNQYDTDSMRSLMEANGFETKDFSEECDIYIINTCTVTNTSDKKSRQIISRAHKKNPDAIIVVCGCYARMSKEEVQSLAGVDIVLGTNDRRNIVDIIKNYLNEKEEQSNTDDAFEEIAAVHSDKTRAYLKIQDGCNSFCSYCIIPYARGRVRSRKLENVLYEIKRLDSEGFKEIVLTGIHLLSYGSDFEEITDICDVLVRLDGLKSIKRIRLGSLDPDYIDERFISTVKNCPYVCRHFHLSLQSGSDSVLKRMNRKYTTEEFYACVQALRQSMPDCAITTDIIAGFPGETREEHMETLEFIKKVGFSRLHVFPYSQRKGTVAAKMPNQIPKAEKERRAGEVIALGDEMQYKFHENYVGKTVSVLFEEVVGGFIRGYTEDYVDVHVKNEGHVHLINRFADVNIIQACPKHLMGTII